MSFAGWSLPVVTIQTSPWLPPGLGYINLKCTRCLPFRPEPGCPRCFGRGIELIMVETDPRLFRLWRLRQRLMGLLIARSA